ncbi:BQ2448_1064 [Microbotryum intermedium]|uniref:BQ2448_1064 protein n=1 Tax=Microbotryum intermedium TaxID=269621 RepID=A0A238F741_9BASI|nr:BQ2448_1064 [Microbotryum intermedium]
MGCKSTTSDPSGASTQSKVITPPLPTSSTAVPSRDVLQRLNYLYQASTLLGTLVNRTGSGGGSTDGLGGVRVKVRDGKRRRKEREGRLIATQPIRSTQSMGMEVEMNSGMQSVDEGRGSRVASTCKGKMTPRTKTTITEEGEGEARDSSTKTESKSESSSRGNGKRKRHHPSPTPHDPTQQGQAPHDVLHSVSCSLAGLMHLVAQKATVKMNPSVKRTVCKGCRSVLVAGVSSSVRVKPSGPHGHRIVHTCLACQTTRKIPSPPIKESSSTNSAATVDEVPLPPTETMSTSNPSILPPPPPPSSTTTTTRTPIPIPAPKSILTAKELRRLRKPVFFERKDHVTIPGTRV